MKKVRIILSALAIFLAFSGAVVSQHLTVVPGYEFIDREGVEDDECIYRRDCDTDGTIACKVGASTPVLREHSDPATSCGLTLKMKNQ